MQGNHRVPSSISPTAFLRGLSLSGNGFKDLIRNYPNLFEVTEPDDLPSLGASAVDAPPEKQFELLAPADNAAAVCVIDSGLQEAHILLRHAIDVASSRSFLSGVEDVAAHVAPAGPTRAHARPAHGANASVDREATRERNLCHGSRNQWTGWTEWTCWPRQGYSELRHVQGVHFVHGVHLFRTGRRAALPKLNRPGRPAAANGTCSLPGLCVPADHTVSSPINELVPRIAGQLVHKLQALSV